MLYLYTTQCPKFNLIIALNMLSQSHHSVYLTYGVYINFLIIRFALQPTRKHRILTSDQTSMELSVSDICCFIQGYPGYGNIMHKHIHRKQRYLEPVICFYLRLLHTIYTYKLHIYNI